MTSGGARARSGPAPDPDALSRDRDAGDWKLLPVDGRDGDPPAWPLGGQQTKREKQLWVELWALPQAIMWEKLRLDTEVALYVRRLREVEKPNATAALANHLIRMAESLGLTTAGLHRNRWIIDQRRTVPSSKPKEPEVVMPEGSRTRGRFTVVPGGGGE